MVKRIRILFDDMGSSRSKIGDMVSRDDSFIEIKTDNRTELIPISKIIRVEFL